jgi:hypothetical protein
MRWSKPGSRSDDVIAQVELGSRLRREYEASGDISLLDG